jgi:adenylate kinase
MTLMNRSSRVAETSQRTVDLFDRGPSGRCAVITGQVGLDKKPLLERLETLATERGKSLTVCNVGDRMYAEAPDVVPGRILDLPLGRLNSLRRAVFKDILTQAGEAENLIVNTHATFRWRHGLFPAFDHDQMAELGADLYLTLVENVDAVHERLDREHDLDHTLKDLLVWREEEILATEVLATALRGHGAFYVVSRPSDALNETVETLYRLLFEPRRRKVYPSFPMTHIMDAPAVLAEVASFRQLMAEHFTVFDPGDLDERRLLLEAEAATDRGDETFTLTVHDRAVAFSAAAVTAVAGDIDGQIYARDFKLIDQADMIVSYIPQRDGRPVLSSGVERELQHAHEATKEVYVVWRSASAPSPFITETAMRVFGNLDETMRFFQQKGYVGDVQLPLETGH